MTAKNFIHELKLRLDAPVFSWCAAALHQDSLVWDSLTGPVSIGSLGAQALENFTNEPSNWTPAALALLALGNPITITNLRDPDWVMLEPDLHRQADQLFDSWISEWPATQWTLADVGLVALALRERQVFHGNWGFLMEISKEVLSWPGHSTGSVVACLVGMAADPAELLATLLSLDTRLALHGLLCCPATVEQQAVLLPGLLHNSPEAILIETIQMLSQVRPELIAFLEPLVFPALPDPTAQQQQIKSIYPAAKAISANTQSIHHLTQRASAFAASQQLDQALMLYHKALHASRQVQAVITDQVAQTYYSLTQYLKGVEADSTDTANEASEEHIDKAEMAALQAWEEAIRLDPDTLAYHARFAWALLEVDRIEEAQATLDQIHPTANDSSANAEYPMLYWATQARLAARRADLEQANIYLNKASVSYNPELVEYQVLIALAELGVEIGNLQIAEQLVRQALENQPNDPTALTLSARIQLAMANSHQGLEDAQLANSFSPNVERLRLVVNALEANGEWNQALSEHQNLLSLLYEPASADFHSLAACALQAGLPETAVEACHQALKLDPQDGLALRLLGDIALSEGNSTIAFDYFQQAVHASPNKPPVWLSLARFYQDSDQPERALETLRQASQAVPDSIELNLELGQALLKENSPTLALIPLRHAAAFAFGSKQPTIYETEARRNQQSIALLLGRTLRELGYLEESHQTFSRVCGEFAEDSSIDPIISYEYAKTLLSLGDTKAALPWLDHTVTRADNQAAQFDYARAILSLEPDPDDLDLAVDLLQKVLKDQAIPIGNEALQPADYAEAYALLAESLQTKGDLPGALQAYRKALDSNLIQQHAWRSRLSYGLGRSAMSLGQTETAITAFLEAGQADPTDSEIYRSLAEAYAEMDLTDDAFQAAKKAVRLKSDHPETLIWYVELCLQLYDRPTGKGLPAYDYAQQALERAISITPERSDLWVRLAQLQILRGNSDGALETLKKLSETQADQMTLSVETFSQAADLLHKIGEPAQATLLLEQAIQLVRLDQPADERQVLAGLFRQLADMNYAAGNFPAGLEAINQAIALNPDNPAGYRQRSMLHIAQNNLSGAVESLTGALVLDPENWEIHLQKALVQQALGELTGALEQAELAVSGLALTTDGGAECFARWLAANLASNALLDDRARENLKFTSRIVLPFEVACHNAELAFELADIESVTGALASVLEVAPHHPHLLALQARLIGFQEGITETSLQLFESCLSSPESNLEKSLNDIVLKINALSDPFFRNQINRLQSAEVVQAMTKAALDLKQWQPAENLCDQVIDLLPDFPAGYLLRVRWLVTRAETQQISQDLQMIQRAPGAGALDKTAQDAFEQALKTVLSMINLSSDSASQSAIHWQVRGQVIFNHNSETNAALRNYVENTTPSIADLSALVWSMCQLEQLADAEQKVMQGSHHPLITAQLALALSRNEPDRAALITQQAIEHLAFADLNMLDPRPMLNALIAIISNHPNAQPEDLSSGLTAIEAALEFWPDEANWHSLAADLLESLGAVNTSEEQASIQMHLEQAAQLEPTNTKHHFKLGRFYARIANYPQALASFEIATNTDPENAEAWLALAKIQKEIRQFEKAISSVERTLNFASQSIDALLLRSELALLTNNPRGALSRAQTIINITPDHPQAWYLIAQSYVALDQLEQALQAIEQTISLDNDPLEAQRLRAHIVYALSGPQRAIEAIQPLLDIYPNDPVLCARLADYYDELRDYGKSIQAARLALQACTEELSAETQTHLHLMIGKQARVSGQLDQAVYHLNEAIRKTPDSIEAYLELGRVHQDRRQNNQAMEIYQMAAKIAPTDYHPYYQAGLALKESKDYLGAETMFRRAAHLAPNEVNIHRQLAAVVALNLVHNRRVPITD